MKSSKEEAPSEEEAQLEKEAHAEKEVDLLNVLCNVITKPMNTILKEVLLENVAMRDQIATLTLRRKA